MFKLHSVGSAKTAPMELYTITAAETVVLGEALVLTSGKLTKCGATAIPEFISMGSGTAVEIPVIRVMEDYIFETAFSADASLNAEGTKVTIDSTGLLVTATATNGVFAITKKLGTGEATTKVRGMFRR